MPDIQMIVLLMLHQNMNYQLILEVYGFLLALTKSFRVKSRSLYHLVSI